MMCFFLVFFFFKQKTAYEMRISDWSSDVCSSDLLNLTLSDRSGQFQSSCFDEIAGKTLEALAADGGCAMLSVELDLLEGEETPRVTVRGDRKSTRLNSSH